MREEQKEIPMNPYTLLMLVVFLLVSCEPTTEEPSEKPATNSDYDVGCTNRDPNGVALFGDVHVHTSYSFDAAANSFNATPTDAHLYAKGKPIKFFPLDAAGIPVGTTQIDRPLDFLAVTDHGEFLGERRLCRTPGSPSYDTEFCAGTRVSERQGMMMMAQLITSDRPSREPAICGDDGQLCREYAKSPWQDIQAAANDANDPCNFTAFIAYEYTGTPNTSNYHRNVIFRDANVPELPVSYVDAPVDSKLWSGLNATCLEAEGCDYLTIPHNTNLANGRMAPYMGLEDTIVAKREYAKIRQKREPIMEIFQHKGGSECINGLSTVLGAPDELCNQEAVRTFGDIKKVTQGTMIDGELVTSHRPITTTECEAGELGAYGMLGGGCVDESDFQRSALLVGLKEELSMGVNPIKLGIIAATDTHSANPGGIKESDWAGAVSGESNPQERLQKGLLTSGIDGNPGGLAGVWASENTRGAIFDAMLRREVFGTSGPRIKVRLFAGWDFDANLCDSPSMIDNAYRDGVPMGADLEASASLASPTILAWATQDPMGQKLQSLQLIKGWIDDQGQMHNEVVSLAEDASGQGSFCVIYQDRQFDPGQSAYYYLRAVEPETPRWHTYDCGRITEAERPEVCSNGTYSETIREMAWSSPIWYKSR